jgi:hypothetical protein
MWPQATTSSTPPTSTVYHNINGHWHPPIEDRNTATQTCAAIAMSTQRYRALKSAPKANSFSTIGFASIPNDRPDIKDRPAIKSALKTKKKDATNQYINSILRGSRARRAYTRQGDDGSTRRVCGGLSERL